jgi:hypothetical protein
LQQSANEKVLWVTVGQSAAPLILAILTLEPEEVVPICAEQTRPVLDHLKDSMRGIAISPPRVKWRPAIQVPPDDPHEIMTTLTQARPPMGDLFYVGGTAAMVAAVNAHWIAGRGTSTSFRSWYLADRAGELRADTGDVVSLLRSPLLASELESIVRLTARSSDGPPTVRARHTTKLGPGDALEGMAPDWPLAPGDDAQETMELLAAMGSAVLGVGSVGHGRTGQLAREWNGLGTGVDIHDDFRQFAGDVLEVLVYMVTARLLGQTRRQLSTELRLGASIGNSVELDVTIVSGPRLTLISCGQDANRANLTSKHFEAKERTRSLGGGEARSLTVALRTGGARRRSDPAGATEQMDDHRRDAKVGEAADRDRHRLIAPLEMFTSADAKDLLEDLLDPSTRLLGDGARPAQREIAAFLIGSLFP